MALFKIVRGENPREIAARVLARRDSGEYVEGLLDSALSQARLSSRDRSLCQQLVYGVVRWQDTLDWLIARKTPGRNQKKLLQDLLRLGLFQIFWLERIPNHAAVNETVTLARSFGFGAQAGFVNALLRGYLREADSTRQELEALKTAQPHLGFSHPEWLVQRWQARWGGDSAAKLMAWNNAPAKTFARINTLKVQPGRLLELWREENVEYDFVRRDWLPEALSFELKAHPPLEKLESFQRGFFYVQDPSTLLAPAELQPRSGERILDLCAAPGGKLTCIAQLIGNTGMLVAHDTSAKRRDLIRENCARLGVTCVEVSDFNSPQPPNKHAEFISAPSFGAAFDRVLLDAPCSNTGVLRRRVDLRWRLHPDELKRLPKLQLQLLDQAAPLLKPAGILVYSTCSVEPEENQHVVQEFLRTHPGFSLERERELLPFQDEVDGAYVARIAKHS
jgi:16S rRNA (cytosine967-C5)-methyltransferase